MPIQMLNAPCDRCGKVKPELRPYELTDSITYRGKRRDHPWMCIRCFVVEKKKWWKARDVRQAAPR